MYRLKIFLFVLVAWTISIWVGRVQNVVTDDGWRFIDSFWRLVVAAVFFGFSCLCILLLSSWRRLQPIGSTRLIAMFCLWTIAFWVVRGFGMAFSDRDIDFKIIHSALALVSIVLAFYVYQLDRKIGSQRSVGSNGVSVSEKERGDSVEER